MVTTRDPFEAGRREALRSTDELLDRIGARAPMPEDLDDPVAAALALMAAEIDVDAVPLESTRGALDQALAERGLGMRRLPGAPASGEEARPALRGHDDPDADAVEILASHGFRVTTTAVGPVGRDHDDHTSRVPRRPGRRPGHAAVAMAPPRSLPRFAPPPGRPGGAGSRPDGRPLPRLRPPAAVVAAVAAILLGGGVAAAVAGSLSVNPVAGLQQVVVQLTNGRTVDQQKLYDADLQRIEAARFYVQQGKESEAVHQLNRVSTQGLSDDDYLRILAQVKQVLGLLRPE